MPKDKITIYTDGAAKGNPGQAGWGAVFIVGKKVFEIGGFSPHATNNIMELTAPIEAFKYIQKNKLTGEVEVVSDSKYVILGITEWIPNWMQNNWRNANKKPVLNRELWEELYKLAQELRPKWTYVKGHNDHEHNDRADLIATSFAEGAPIELKKLKN
jgi:ribonuclease HI